MAWRHAASCASKCLKRYASAYWTRFFHGGFPVDALLTRCLDLVETSAFGGFAAKRDLLRDLGELIFEGASGVSAHL
ncbi:hypothetical protein OG298_00855 [Streptomyces sp. NBC_01005]|uniref:hypothetical protein n=1 Tax=unclassified Streptomyces TaxID=2593676 RepID=UPI002E369F1E|nr:hypothetical protein [Streptomyces sp. NBC_01362]WSW03035.1 hypothetical protein OG298_00855 [Streptomyces sp. NBC_01005]WTC92543.1 hypothetical protein OH736_00865 [Streptomyces sp. NBC_01650]